MFEFDPDEEGQRRNFSRRALIFGAAQTAGLALVAGKVFKAQVIDGPRYALLGDENRISVELIAAERARILDRFGEVLASNAESYRAVVVPALAGDLLRTIGNFARVVPISADAQARILAQAKRQPRSHPILMRGDLTFEQIAEINVLAPHLPGIRTERDMRRTYHHVRHAGHVVGYVGAVERIAADDPAGLRLPGMWTGRAGVERGLEEHLRGQPGHVKHEVNARGGIVRDLERVEPRPARDAVLTIDMALQSEVVDRLAREERGAVVAMHIATGEILAMASAPLFDPARLAAITRGRRTGRVDTVFNNPMINRAVQGAYPPGATFKMVTALAALELGVVAPREKITCDGRFEHGGQLFRCWRRRGHGACDLNRALKESCDVYFYELARRTGIDAIARMARRLGLGHIHDIGIGPQRAGVVPDADWKLTRQRRSWLAGDTIQSGIGQGYVEATPLQLAVMTARLASGRQVRPVLVAGASGQPSFASPPVASLGIADEWLDLVRAALVGAVNEDGGTGTSARIDTALGRMAGKIGTAQVSRLSTDDRLTSELTTRERDHALFVGFAPVDAPKYAVVAVLEHGGGGGKSAGPLARDVMELLLTRDPIARPIHQGAQDDAATGKAG